MFLLDIKYDMINNQIIKWIKYKDFCKPIKEVYYPKIYVTYSDLHLIDIIKSLHGVKDAFIEEKKLLNGKKVNVICISLEGKYIYNVASILEEKYRLFNIDVGVIRQYLLEHSLYPFSNNKDSQFDIDYEFPKLKCAELIISENLHNSFNKKIDYVRIGDNIIEGKESDILEDLNKEIYYTDPDLLYTNNGDSYELPYLYHRASLHNVNLQLGRDKDIFNGKDRSRSFFSYGRILYKPKKHILSGRLHIDRSYFLFREGGLPGIIDISRITGMPLQELSRVSPGSAVTALQVNQAIRDNIIIPWKRYNTEYWKTAEQLLVADRGALVLEPNVGIHENIFELDFQSLFPNIMVKHNISPETVLCECCNLNNNSKRVPFIGYNICQKHEGIIPRVLKPIIERRMEFKRRSKLYKSKLGTEYDNKQSILKWLLVTSFGYMGFNKAIFGRIECHESITAFARDILLRSIEIADDLGYEILHGIVDCLWIKGNDPEKLCDIVSKEIGINLEFKGKFNWIVFLPNKTNDAGSLNRYYGAMEDGKVKIRGIEMRRSDTPLIIKNLQSDMIAKLAEAKNISEFYSKIPDSINILKEYSEKVLSGEYNLNHLIFQINISRECEKYQQFNNQVAALMQLKEEGIDVRPGQSIRYIITDHKSKDYHKRIILPEYIDINTRYDITKYFQYLLKGAESVLLPFGYTENRLEEILKRKIQKNLLEFQ